MPGPRNALDGVIETFNALRAFAREARAANVDYENIGVYAESAGWVWNLQQIDQVPNGNAMHVTFEIAVGRVEVPEKNTMVLPLRVLDRLTVTVPANNPDTSVLALMRSSFGLLFRLFGYLPPAQLPAEQPGEQVVTMPDRDVALPETMNGGLNVIAKITPDGLPVLRDLAAIPDEFDEDTIDAAVIEMVRDTLPQLTAAEQVEAFYKLNAGEFEFLDNKARMDLLAMFRDRNAELAMAPAGESPRRRRQSRAVPVN